MQGSCWDHRVRPHPCEQREEFSQCSVCVCMGCVVTQGRRLGLSRELKVGGPGRQTGRATPSPHSLSLPLGQDLDEIFWPPPSGGGGYGWEHKMTSTVDSAWEPVDVITCCYSPPFLFRLALLISAQLWLCCEELKAELWVFAWLSVLQGVRGRASILTKGMVNIRKQKMASCAFPPLLPTPEAVCTEVTQSSLVLSQTLWVYVLVLSLIGCWLWQVSLSGPQFYFLWKGSSNRLVVRIKQVDLVRCKCSMC